MKAAMERAHMHTPKIIPLRPTQAVPETMPGLPAPWPKNAPPYFHVLGKPSGATCNLDCTYCFFLSKEKLYPNSRFRMSDETLETYIRQLIESQRAPEVTISWQGGEPTLMGLDFFKRAMDARQTLHTSRHDRPAYDANQWHPLE
jgi:hypothetical protein